MHERQLHPWTLACSRGGLSAVAVVVAYAAVAVAVAGAAFAVTIDVAAVAVAVAAVAVLTLLLLNLFVRDPLLLNFCSRPHRHAAGNVVPCHLRVAEEGFESHCIRLPQLPQLPTQI